MLKRLFLPFFISIVMVCPMPADAAISIPTVNIKGSSKLQKGVNKVKIIFQDDISLATIFYKAPGKKRSLVLPVGTKRKVVIVRFRTSRRRARISAQTTNTSGVVAVASRLLRSRN